MWVTTVTPDPGVFPVSFPSLAGVATTRRGGRAAASATRTPRTHAGGFWAAVLGPEIWWNIWWTGDLVDTPVGDWHLGGRSNICWCYRKKPLQLMEEIPGQPPGDVTNPVSSGIKLPINLNWCRCFFLSTVEPVEMMSSWNSPCFSCNNHLKQASSNVSVNSIKIAKWVFFCWGCLANAWNLFDCYFSDLPRVHPAHMNDFENKDHPPNKRDNPLF